MTKETHVAYVTEYLRYVWVDSLYTRQSWSNLLKRRDTVKSLRKEGSKPNK